MKARDREFRVSGQNSEKTKHRDDNAKVKTVEITQKDKILKK